MGIVCLARTQPVAVCQKGTSPLKNSLAPASDPLFSPNGTILKAREPGFGPQMDLQPTFSTGSNVFDTSQMSFNKG